MRDLYPLLVGLSSLSFLILLDFVGYTSKPSERQLRPTNIEKTGALEPETQNYRETHVFQSTEKRKESLEGASPGSSLVSFVAMYQDQQSSSVSLTCGSSML